MRYQWRNERGTMLKAEKSDNGFIKVPDEIRDETGMGETWEVTIWRDGQQPQTKRVVGLEADDYEHPSPSWSKT